MPISDDGHGATRRILRRDNDSRTPASARGCAEGVQHRQVHDAQPPTAHGAATPPVHIGNLPIKEWLCPPVDDNTMGSTSVDLAEQDNSAFKRADQPRLGHQQHPGAHAHLQWLWRRQRKR